MTKGRKPIPTKLKVLRGNPGKRKANVTEPKPVAAIPDCPKHLSSEAKAEWNRIVPELMSLGLLTRVDRAALAGYCQAWGRWVKAEDELAKTAEIVKTTQGNAIQNPWLSVANRAWDQLSKALVGFGMDPSSRTRIHAPGGQKLDDFEEFLTRNARNTQQGRRKA